MLRAENFNFNHTRCSRNNNMTPDGVPGVLAGVAPSEPGTPKFKASFTKARETGGKTPPPVA